jgi:large subunit ribosomal protein L20
MARVKGGVQANKRRKNILARVKGFRFDRSTKTRAAIDALKHAGLHAFAHRKDKKGDFRQLWIARINAAIRTHGMTYSRFMKALKGKEIILDRKVLATLAKDNAAAFDRIVAHVK